MNRTIWRMNGLYLRHSLETGSKQIAGRLKPCDGLVVEDPGGVFDSGTYEEDGPVTWEAPTSPVENTAYGEPYPNLRRSCVLRMHAANRQRTKTFAAR